MASIQIEKIFAMDPMNRWQEKRAFLISDRFGLMMIVSASSDLVAQRPRFDILYQMVNPIDEPNERHVWFQELGHNGPVTLHHTIDWHFRDQLFPRLERFGIYIGWPTYSDAVRPTRGPGLVGVFSARGSISIVGTDLFDLTDPFAFNFKVRRD